MDSLTDARQISRPEVVDTGCRHRWSDVAKLRIVEESLSAPQLVSATARRHGISNQLLFAWRKPYRDGRLGAAIAGFVSATIVPARPEEGSGPTCGEIEIVNGRRVLVDVEALLRIVRGLETLRLCGFRQGSGLAGDRSHRHEERLCEPVAGDAAGAAARSAGRSAVLLSWPQRRR